MVSQVSVSESHVEPRRVERRRSGDRSLDPWKEWIQVLDRAQVERRHIDVEAVKCREGREKDVELAFTRELGNCSRDVRILEDERRAVDLEMVERPAGCPHLSREFSLPVVREFLSVEGAEEIEI